jgi:outer membrane autotransporter protein
MKQHSQQNRKIILRRKNIYIAVASVLPALLISGHAFADCAGSVASPGSAAITVLCNNSGTSTSGNLTNTDTTTYVNSGATATAGNNTLLQFDGQGRTLENSGSIINNLVITGAAGARGRTAVFMGNATLNAGSGTVFTNNAPTAGVTTVTLNAAPTAAYVGQTIVFGRYDGDDFSLGERRVITAVDIVNKTVTFTTPLTADFAGSGTDSAAYKVVSNYGEGSVVNGTFYNNVINNSGTISTQITKAEIDGDRNGATSVSYTAAAKAITASVEGAYLINNTATGVISAKQAGIGSALAIEEGGTVEEMTINNAGLIVAERSAPLTLVSVTATGNPTATSSDYSLLTTAQTVANVNAINTQEEAEEIVINNTSTGIIRSIGDYTNTIYMRAGEKEITNAGLIEHVAHDGTNTKGFAIAAVSNPSDIRTFELENTATGVIKGDILAVNGNALRWYLLSTEGGGAGIDSRLNINSQYGQSDSEIENAGTILGNFYYSNGTHELENESTGVITGNIDVDQRATVDLVSGVATNSALLGTRTFTFENAGTFTGNITIHDVAGSDNAITLEGNGFAGNIAATTGAGSNTLNLLGAGTLRGDIAKFTTLNLGVAGNAPVDDDDDDEGVSGAPSWTLAVGKTAEFTDVANLNAGLLNVLGNLKANTIVGEAATLTGTGTITGNLTNNGLVDLAPDTTLHVAGNATFNAGSILRTTVSTTGYGQLAVTGTATFNDGALVKPVIQGGVVTSGQSFTVLISSGITGAPEIASNGLLHWNVSTVGNNLVLTADVQGTNISGASAGAASAVNALLSFDNPLGLQLQNLGSAAEVQKAAEQLRPEINGASMNATLRTTSQVEGVVDARISETHLAQANGLRGMSAGDGAVDSGVWLQGFGFAGQQDRINNVDGYKANGGGMAAGADTLLSDALRVGAAFSYANTTLDAQGSNIGNNNRINSYQGMLYASWLADGWYLNGIAGVGQHQFDSRRLVNIGGVIDNPKANYDAWQYFGKVELGLPIAVNNQFSVVPVASLAFSYLDQDAYTETSTNGAALSVQSNDSTSFRSGLGGKAFYNFTAGDIKTVLEGRAIWQHEFADTKQDTTASFAAGGSTFIAQGVAIKREAFNLGASLKFVNEDATQSLSLSYDADIRDQYIGHTGKVQARFDF